MHITLEVQETTSSPSKFDHIVKRLNEIHAETKARNPRGFLDEFESRFEDHCLDITMEMNYELDILPGSPDIFRFWPTGTGRQLSQAEHPLHISKHEVA